MTQLEWIFKNVLGEKGYFVYIPAHACEDLRTGEANAVEFKLDRSNTARYSWRGHPLLPEIEKIEQGEMPLFRANILEISEWNQLVNAFRLERGWGYLDLHDGSVAEFVVAETTIGKKKDGIWELSMRGQIVAVKRRFPTEQITRIAHLVEERLHQARKVEPSEIIHVADFLELGIVR